MSYRIHLTIKNNDMTVFNGQVLGNNEYFTPDMLEQLGVVFDEDELFFEEQPVDLATFHKVFKQHFINEISSWTKDEWTSVFESLTNPSGLVHTHPSWTVMGNYAIVVDVVTGCISRMMFKQARNNTNYTATLRGG